MAGYLRILARQRLRFGPMLPTGMPSRGLISDKDLDVMLDQAFNIADPKEREMATGAILRKIHDDALNMPLWTVSNIYLARNNITWSPALNATWPVLWNIEKKS